MFANYRFCGLAVLYSIQRKSWVEKKFFYLYFSLTVQLHVIVHSFACGLSNLTQINLHSENIYKKLVKVFMK